MAGEAVRERRASAARPADLTKVAAGPTLEVHATSPHSWVGAAPEWATLFARIPAASPYLSEPWVGSFIDAFASNLPCDTVFVRDEHRALIGACLLTRRTDRRAIVPLRRHFLNTSGEPDADSVVVEHNAVLCLPDRAVEVYGALAEHVRASRADELLLAGLTEDAVAQFCRSLPAWRVDIEWRDSPFVDLNALRAAGADHFSAISRNTREQLRRSIRRYSSAGPITLESAATEPQALAMFEDMVALHQAYWSSRGQGGGFASTTRLDFHRGFISRAFEPGYVQLIRVCAGDQVLGVLYNLVAKGHVCFYQSGLNYAVDPQGKPGMLVHHLAIQHALANGLARYDFLPSGPGEGRYKRSLSTSSVRLGTLMLQRPGWRRSWFGLMRALRTLAVRGNA